MTDRKTVTENIYFEHEYGDNLFLKFKNAWCRIPLEFQQKAYIIDDVVYWTRPETDAEQAERIEVEQRKAEREARLLAIKNGSHLVNELQFAINSGLMDINNNWHTIKTGQDMTLKGSVPMPDGRQAKILIKVSAAEQEKSND